MEEKIREEIEVFIREFLVGINDKTRKKILEVKGFNSFDINFKDTSEAPLKVVVNVEHVIVKVGIEVSGGKSIRDIRAFLPKDIILEFDMNINGYKILNKEELEVTPLDSY